MSGEHNSVISRLTERINLLKVLILSKGLEENMITAESDVKRCRNELDESIEVCMEKKKILTEAKAVRHGEMKAIQNQLDHLKYEIELGNLRPIVDRMTHVMEAIWSTPGVIRPEIAEVLPVLMHIPPGRDHEVSLFVDYEGSNEFQFVCGINFHDIARSPLIQNCGHSSARRNVTGY